MADSPLRIAFVALCFPPDVGGSEIYNFEYARRLHLQGHALRVFTWGKGESAEREFDSALPFEVHRERTRLVRGAIDPGGLETWLAGANQDVVFVSRGSKRLCHVVPIAARRDPIVISIHDLGGRHTRRGPIGRWRVRRRYGLDLARVITVISDDTRRRVAALAPRAPISLVYPGTDTRWFRPDEPLRERTRERLGLTGHPVLLTVSRLAASKGHVRVIESLPALRARFPGLVYLVVGEGDRRGPLEARAAELGIADAVRFTGRVDDTRAYYAASDVFVMPSGRAAGGKAGEGFGISYVEAGACGLPVIASRSGGGAEIVVDGETGRVIDPNESHALEQAIAGLLADPAAAQRMGEAARRRCASFDWEHGVEALEAVLREVACGRERPVVPLRHTRL